MNAERTSFQPRVRITRVFGANRESGANEGRGAWATAWGLKTPLSLQLHLFICKSPAITEVSIDPTYAGATSLWAVLVHVPHHLECRLSPKLHLTMERWMQGTQPALPHMYTGGQTPF